MDLTVHPFILRGVSLLGIDSVQTPISRRREVWQRLATDLRPRRFEELGVREIALSDIADTLGTVAAGLGSGRTIVNIAA